MASSDGRNPVGKANIASLESEYELPIPKPNERYPSSYRDSELSIQKEDGIGIFSESPEVQALSKAEATLLKKNLSRSCQRCGVDGHITTCIECHKFRHLEQGEVAVPYNLTAAADDPNNNPVFRICHGETRGHTSHKGQLIRVRVHPSKRNHGFNFLSGECACGTFLCEDCTKPESYGDHPGKPNTCFSCADAVEDGKLFKNSEFICSQCMTRCPMCAHQGNFEGFMYHRACLPRHMQLCNDRKLRPPKAETFHEALYWINLTARDIERETLELDAEMRRVKFKASQLAKKKEHFNKLNYKYEKKLFNINNQDIARVDDGASINTIMSDYEPDTLSDVADHGNDDDVKEPAKKKSK